MLNRWSTPTLPRRRAILRVRLYWKQFQHHVFNQSIHRIHLFILRKYKRRPLQIWKNVQIFSSWRRKFISFWWYAWFSKAGKNKIIISLLCKWENIISWLNLWVLSSTFCVHDNTKQTVWIHQAEVPKFTKYQSVRSWQTPANVSLVQSKILNRNWFQSYFEFFNQSMKNIILNEIFISWRLSLIIIAVRAIFISTVCRMQVAIVRMVLFFVLSIVYREKSVWQFCKSLIETFVLVSTPKF